MRNRGIILANEGNLDSIVENGYKALINSHYTAQMNYSALFS